MSDWLNQRLLLCVVIGLLMGLAAIEFIRFVALPFLWMLYVA